MSLWAPDCDALHAGFFAHGALGRARSCRLPRCGAGNPQTVGLRRALVGSRAHGRRAAEEAADAGQTGRHSALADGGRFVKASRFGVASQEVGARAGALDVDWVRDLRAYGPKVGAAVAAGEGCGAESTGTALADAKDEEEGEEGAGEHAGKEACDDGYWGEGDACCGTVESVCVGGRW